MNVYIKKMDANVHNLARKRTNLALPSTENSATRASAKFCSQILELH